MPQSSTCGAAPSVSTYLLLATVPLIWGTHFVALKVVFEEYSVLGMLSGRYILMSVALLAILWLTERDLRLAWRDVPYLVGFSVVMVTFYQVVFACAIHWSAPGESALLISTAPIFAALSAAALRWEPLTPQLVAGVACGFTGVAVVVYGGRGLDYLPRTHVLGSLVMLVAAVMWAWYAVLARPLLQRYSPLKVTAYCQTLGGLVLIVLGLPNLVAVTPRVWGQLASATNGAHAFWVLFGLAYYAWFSGAYAFTVWYRGVRVLGSSRTMLFQFCVPVVGLLAAIVFRGEYPSAMQWLGAALTVGGVAFTLTRRQRPAAPAVTHVEGTGVVHGTDPAD